MTQDPATFVVRRNIIPGHERWLYPTSAQAV
jgi:hypothetical protein